MKKLIAALTLGLLSQIAHADMVKIDFTYDYALGREAPSIGSLTMSLNGDGTVAAQLSVAANQRWYGAGVDSTAGFRSSEGTTFRNGGWGTSQGSFYTGVNCGSGCTGPISWTISGKTPMTSVSELLTGGNSRFDGFFYTGNQYGGNAVKVAEVPEPSSLALLGLGLAGATMIRRRRAAGTAVS